MAVSCLTLYQLAPDYLSAKASASVASSAPRSARKAKTPRASILTRPGKDKGKGKFSF
jgi:hypothetical protein